MASAPYALSIHNFISSVGADAGFASIIGLAILVLLYFAHARETSALREQAVHYQHQGLEVDFDIPSSLPPLPAAVEVAVDG